MSLSNKIVIVFLYFLSFYIFYSLFSFEDLFFFVSLKSRQEIFVGYCFYIWFSNHLILIAYFIKDLILNPIIYISIIYVVAVAATFVASMISCIIKMRPFSLILFAALQIMLKYLNILIIDLNQFKRNPSYNQLVIDLLELKGGFVK